VDRFDVYEKLMDELRSHRDDDSDDRAGSELTPSDEEAEPDGGND